MAYYFMYYINNIQLLYYVMYLLYYVMYLLFLVHCQTDNKNLNQAIIYWVFIYCGNFNVQNVMLHAFLKIFLL